MQFEEKLGARRTCLLMSSSLWEVEYVQSERAARPARIVFEESMVRSCRYNLVVVWRACALDLPEEEEWRHGRRLPFCIVVFWVVICE